MTLCAKKASFLLFALFEAPLAVIGSSAFVETKVGTRGGGPRFFRSPSSRIHVDPIDCIVTKFGRRLRVCDGSTNSRCSLLHLASSRGPGDPGDVNKPRVRFTGVDVSHRTEGFGSANVSGSPVDYILTLLTSDVGSIVLGLLGLVLLLVGRSFLNAGGDAATSIESLGQETRSNLLAVFSCGALLLNGLSKLDVESALAEAVTLVGSTLEKPAILNSAFGDPPLSSFASDIGWTMNALLAATPAKTAVLLKNQKTGGPWEVVAAAGVVPASKGEDSDSDPLDELAVPTKTPIVDRFKSSSSSKLDQETYLPTLQALPGKTEFTYLPVNSQAVLLLPVNDHMEVQVAATVLVLGSNRARIFTPRDIAWCRSLVTRLACS